MTKEQEEAVERLSLKSITSSSLKLNDYPNMICLKKDVIEVLSMLKGKDKEIEKQEKENTDLKELYIRTAKHQEKIGHVELAEYMLAQIEAVPTFTTWEEYTTWVSKDSIRKILDKYKTKEIDFAPEFYKEIKELLEEK